TRHRIDDADLSSSAARGAAAGTRRRRQRRSWRETCGGSVDSSSSSVSSQRVPVSARGKQRLHPDNCHWTILYSNATPPSLVRGVRVWAFTGQSVRGPPSA